MAGNLSKLRLNQGAIFCELRKVFRTSVLIKEGKHFGVLCETEMSETRNSFACSICMNIRIRTYKNVC